MKDLLVPLLTFLVGLGLAFLLARNRFSLKLSRLSLPFVAFDVSKFAALTHVQMFRALTVLILPNDTSWRDRPGATPSPIVMIHAGWTLVCDAFVQRFKLYPDDENVRSAVATIGGQNADFVIMFRKIHESAIRDTKQVDSAFAEAYLGRAPALAQRLSVDGKVPKAGLVQDFLRQAGVR